MLRAFISDFLYVLDVQSRKRLPWLVLSFFFLALLDILGIALIGFFLRLISDVSGIIQKLPFHHFLSHYHISQTAWIVSTGVVVMCTFAIKVLLNCLILKKSANFGFSAGASLKVRLLKSYQAAPYYFHLLNNSSTLVNIMNNVDQYSRSVVVVALMITSNLLVSVMILGLLAYLHLIETIVLLLLLATILYLNISVLRHKISEHGKIAAESNAGVMKCTNHALRGAQEIKIFNQESYFQNSLSHQVGSWANSNSVRYLYSLLPRLFVESSLSIFIVALCFVYLFSGASPTAIIGFLGVFAAAGARLIPMMNMLTTGINEARFAYPSMKSIVDILKELSEYDCAMSYSGKKQIFNEFGLRHASFTYKNAKIPALSDISITIKKNQSVGFIGKSGSGKSTLVSILCGLLDPDNTTLLIDGCPMTNHREWLNNIAFIPQQIFIMDDTFANNIALGMCKDEIDQEKLQEAIAKARLTDVVNNLDDGLDTLLGENGTRLSGGQRQRIALARAFYFEREIIIMDESTSALDNETEEEIISEIKRLSGHKTLLIIAHRLSTVRHCDHIYKLENGMIIDSGAYEGVVS